MNLIHDGEGRPTRESLYMAMAHLWAKRSLDPRLKVGAIVTSEDMRRVLGIGYNGPAKGLPRTVIRNEPGNSGCLHAEENALLTSDFSIPNKRMFITDSPCELCAHRIINAGVKHVYYDRQYRVTTGLEILESLGIEVIRLDYTSWQGNSP